MRPLRRLQQQRDGELIVIPHHRRVEFLLVRHALISEEVITLGVMWRFLQAKGISTAASMQTEYLDYVQQLIARDGGAPTLNAGRRYNPYLISPWNVPDGNWPGNS